MKRILRSMVLLMFSSFILFAEPSTTAAAAQCSPDHWCLEHPITAMDLYEAWGPAANDVFAVGLGGTILHYNGARWSAMNSGTTKGLMSVWGASSADVFAVGVWGAILHYDGTDWTPMNAGTTTELFTDIWGTSGTDIFALAQSAYSNNGVIRHYDGSSWSAVYATALNSFSYFTALWGSSATNVYAVGYEASGTRALLMRFDGESWSALTPARADVALSGVWGSSPSNVYVVGRDRSGTNVIQRFNGTSWSSVYTGTGPALRGLRGASASNIWAYGSDGAVLCFNGVAWAEVTPAAAWAEHRGAQVFADGSLIVVGSSGTILHRSADSWSVMASAPRLLSVWGTSAQDVFAAGDHGTVLHHDGTTWSTVHADAATSGGGIWGSSATDVFVASLNGVLHYDGFSWSMQSPGNPEAVLYDIWGASGDNVFAVGYRIGDGRSLIAHYDGTSWSDHFTGTQARSLRGVWGSGADDVYVVGDYGLVLHFDGTSWTEVAAGSGSGYLLDIWGASPDEVFAVGTSGRILHYDGTTWSTMISGTTFSLSSIWGTSGSDVYAVGYNPSSGASVLLHYNGTTWSPMNSGVPVARLYGVWAAPAGEVYVVGSDGTILHNIPPRAPGGITLSPDTVAENSAPGTVVGTLGTVDPNKDDTFVYRLAVGEGDEDNALFTVEGETLRTMAIFDREVQGVYRVRVASTDATGKAVEQIFTVVVADVNEAPLFDPGASPAGREGEAIVFTVRAVDPEGGRLTYALVAAPAGAGVDPGSGAFSWTPGFDDGGSHEVVFSASDDRTPPLFSTIAVSVTVEDVNRPPKLDPIGSKHVAKAKTLTVTAGGSDPDGDGLAFDAIGLPDGASFDAATRTFTWTPGEVDLGEHRLTFTVKDDGNPSLDDSEVVVITVGEVLPVCRQGCPYTTIQGAIDAAAVGDVVLVAPGRYRERVRIGKSVTVRRGTGLETPSLDRAAEFRSTPGSWLIIDGDVDANGTGDGSVVTIATPAGDGIRVRLENMVLTGGWANRGGGLLITVTEGGAADVAVVNTVVAMNDANAGGGVAVQVDGVGSSADLRLRSSTVGWNDAGEGGGILVEATNGGTVTLDAANQIVWGNRSAAGEQIHILQDGGGTVRGYATFSDVGGVSYGGLYPESWNAGVAVVDEDPIYANPGLLDLRLLDGSPAIDAGDDASGLADDFEGDARPQGAAEDLGADEHTTGPDFTGLKLTSLNGGERIAAGEPYLITWGAPAGMSTFKVYSSLTGGASWVLLTPVPLSAATRRLAWQVPRPASSATRGLVKITGRFNGRSVSDVSDRSFTIDVVRVMSPNGKEHLVSGDVVPIAWKTCGTSQPVARTLIQYSVNGGETWLPVATIPGNPGSHDWLVPAAVASIGKCRVQVVLRAASGTVVGKDASDANFNAGKVLVISPNGGEVLASGGEAVLSWDAVPEAVSFDLYHTLNGTSYLPLSGGQDITGTTWRGPWPAAAGNMPRSAIKVMGYTAADVLAGSDFSDAFFTTEVLRVVSPNGGETITGGLPATITWATNATVRPVAKTLVATSLNGGTSWTTVTLAGNPGTYDWIPAKPVVVKAQAKVKVVLKDAAGVIIGQDLSDALFTVTR